MSINLKFSHLNIDQLKNECADHYIIHIKCEKCDLLVLEDRSLNLDIKPSQPKTNPDFQEQI